MTEPEDGMLRDRFRQLEAECARLREENARLKGAAPPVEAATVLPAAPPAAAPAGDTAVDRHSPPAAKLALYRSLFRGRDEVYAVRWESKAGKYGYSPACGNEWRDGICLKPKMKCGDCTKRQLQPVTDRVITAHLSGTQTVGLYPLLADETCRFLAIDFDQTGWRADAGAVLDTCIELKVPAALERSRSGNGAHLWIFFSGPVPAAAARRLGCFIITRTTERRPQLGLGSYDRLFPSQDTLPKGGFGNLIALPLQGKAREAGNTVFLDRDFEPFPDQWRFLSGLGRMEPAAVEQLTRAAAATGEILGVHQHVETEIGGPPPWELLPSERERERPITGPFPETVRLTISNLVYIPKAGLPPALVNRLQRLAAFSNPEFYANQAMRHSTFKTPRLISCVTDFPDFIGLPRGCLDAARELLSGLGIKTEIRDERCAGEPIAAAFTGKLTPAQTEAGVKLLETEFGVLVAAPAFGKTVVAVWLIAQRPVTTLILVHRRHLLDQWREMLAAYLETPPGAVGVIGGGRSKPTGVIDIGILQSLNRKGKVNDLVTRYGQVIVDECHHLTAFTYEQIIREVRAKYVVGLTATPVRKNGHHPIIAMQCGPIRYRTDPRLSATAAPFSHAVIVRETKFALPPGPGEVSIQELYGLLAADEPRNDLIFDDLVGALAAGRTPLLLTERVSHLEYFAKRLEKFARNIIVLQGKLGIKQRRETMARLRAIPDGEERLIVATGRTIGEGFDDPRLDTLFLALPISWRGTLQQYAGRLNRRYAGKREVRIYDYVDAGLPVCRRMFERRSRGYRALGYRLGPASAAAAELEE